MPKEITLEMLHAMSPDQRKTLHANASSRDTEAARAVLELLSQDDLMPAPKVAKAPARKSPAKAGTTKAGTPKAPRAKAAPKAKTVAFGRQA